MAEKKISGRTFQVGAVLATESIRLQARLLKLIGGGVDRLPVIMAGVGKEASPAAKEASNAAVIAALSDIFGKADPDEVATLMSDVVGLSSIKRPSGEWEQADIDGDFTEHKGDILPLIGWVLKEVLGDFFSGSLASGDLKKLLKG